MWGAVQHGLSPSPVSAKRLGEVGEPASMPRRKTWLASEALWVLLTDAIGPNRLCLVEYEAQFRRGIFSPKTPCVERRLFPRA